jgi:hypothetical protein
MKDIFLRSGKIDKADEFITELEQYVKSLAVTLIMKNQTYEEVIGGILSNLQQEFNAAREESQASSEDQSSEEVSSGVKQWIENQRSDKFGGMTV